MKPRADWFDDDTPETAREIHEADRPTFTGLYDHRGNQLHRNPEPIGFDPHRWAMKRKGKGGKRCLEV